MLFARTRTANSIRQSNASADRQVFPMDGHIGCDDGKTRAGLVRRATNSVNPVIALSNLEVVNLFLRHLTPKVR